MRRRACRVPAPRSGFAGFRFPPDVLTLAVRWYLRYGLSYRDVKELLAERNILVDHVSIYRWVQTVYPAADRCGTTLPARAGRSLVRR
jgi:transposase-like protein